jgi:hypothetical protein
MLLIAVICITVAAVIQFWRDQLDPDSIEQAEWIHIGLLLPVRGLYAGWPPRSRLFIVQFGAVQSSFSKLSRPFLACARMASEN